MPKKLKDDSELKHKMEKHKKQRTHQSIPINKD